MRSLIEILADRHKVSKEMVPLQEQLSKLKAEEYAVYNEKARQLIGLCFEDYKGNYCKVIDVPKTKLMNAESHLNPFQIPVLVVPVCQDAERFYIDDELPFYFDEVYSKALTCEDTVGRFKEDYNEISNEQFDQLFSDMLESFKEKICQIQ